MLLVYVLISLWSNDRFAYVGVVVIYPCLLVVCYDEDAACGVFGFGAAVDANAGAIGYVLHDGQEAFELRGLGHGDVVAERQNLIALALEGVAEERAIDDETACDGFAFRLISLKTNVHKLIYNWTIYNLRFIYNLVI
jgi:hypothetical protein